MLSQDEIEINIDEQLQLSPEKKKTSLILMNDSYKKASISTIIKLLLRCNKLYEAISEIKKILMMIVKQTEMYFDKDGAI